MTFVSLTLGVLPVAAYGLGFVEAAILIIAFNFLGSLPVGLFSSLGPVFGLRQIPLSRFYFGYQGAKLGTSTVSLEFPLPLFCLPESHPYSSSITSMLTVCDLQPPQ